MERDIERRGNKGEVGGGGEWGEQVVQSVESYISSPWLLRRIGLYESAAFFPFFFFSESDELCIDLRIFPHLRSNLGPIEGGIHAVMLSCFII